MIIRLDIRVLQSRSNAYESRPIPYCFPNNLYPAGIRSLVYNRCKRPKSFLTVCRIDLIHIPRYSPVRLGQELVDHIGADGSFL